MDGRESIYDQIKSVMPARVIGSVVSTEGIAVSVAGFPVPIGALAQIEQPGQEPILAEAVGFRDDVTLLCAYSDLTGIRRGARVELIQTVPRLRVGDELLGRIVNAFGQPIDGEPRPILTERMRYDRRPPDAYARPRIDTVLSTGIRAIDGFLTVGRGQRIGIFAGSGVGKSVTLGMMTRYTDADVIVIGLIGERGREVNDFIERNLGEEGKRKSVVVVSTSNEPALTRVRAAQGAMTIAEYFRDRGKNVLFLIDSLTRYAQALREIGLAAGEAPAAKGFPPSVFSAIPRLVERAGRDRNGSITAFITVLVEGDDKDDPIGDAVRGLLDGHIWLSRKLSIRGHYPAIDPLESISRLMPDICSPEHREAANRLRRLLGVYAENEDLISVGAYQEGTNSEIDRAIRLKPAIDAWLCQRTDEPSTFGEALEGLMALDSAE
ncbi:MAG: FliI/YscN family ATPase [Thermoguttaceae bacterium]|nr:FliI/YscN family ATPase [Thermoguttaceae bacterium]